jgi:hypothetical protein
VTEGWRGDDAAAVDLAGGRRSDSRVSGGRRGRQWRLGEAVGDGGT